MKKKFYIWHSKKSALEKIENEKIFFNEGDIWFLFVGKNLGSEQNGGADFLRATLILKKFNERLFWGIPLTLKNKKGKYYLEVIDFVGQKRVCLLSQLRLFDRKRLKNFVSKVSKEEMKKIKEKIRDWL